MPKSVKVATKTPGQEKSSRKAQMVVATGSLLRQKGLRGVTTKAIAEAIACSEGAIYVHFKDRLELLLAVLQDCLPEMLIPLRALQNKTGTRTPEKNLETALAGLMQFQNRMIPLLCSLVMEPELLSRFKQSLKKTDKGPHRGIATLAEYIRVEQKMGRVDPAVDCNVAAFVLMGTTFFHTFTSKVFDAEGDLDRKGLIRFILRS